MQAKASASLARSIAAVKSLLAFAHRLGYLPFDVGAPLRIPKIKDRLVEWILDEESVQRMIALDQDVPSVDTLTAVSLKHFEKHTLGSPNLLPEGFFIVVDGDHYIGMSNLWKQQSGDRLDVGLTGVLREYRRRGIALALGLRAATYAKNVGCPELSIRNAQSNRAMLSINEAIGFEKMPAWIGYIKTLKEE